MKSIRVGQGVDIHQLVEGRKMILGGVHLPHDKGPLGHSDADVLIHAICDALLGAAALGDIGYHFPDTSSEFKDIDSGILLRQVCDLLSTKGWKIGNVDSTLILEKPKIKPHIPAMQERLSALMGIDSDAISIKATTNEKMGYVGRGEGVLAFASCLIFKD